MPADALQYPLAAPTISGTTYTVDFLLDNPTRVTRIVNDLVMRNFFLDKVFAVGGDVSGGAVIYDQATAYDVYTNADVERVEPGMEAPIVGGDRGVPLTAQVEKFGGKFPITNEARRRNNVSRFNNQTRRLSNTIVRKMHQRGLAELAAVITAQSRTAATISWTQAMALTGTTRAPSLMPMRSIAAARKESENNEMGYDYDTIIANPTEAEALRVCYGSELGAVLADNGISELISTPRKAAGSVYILAGRQVGEMRLEEPLRTTVSPEGAPTLREQDWVQSLVNPVMYVTDPFAILELTGTNA